MADRYFVETPIATDSVELGGPEAHHLIHVMRAKAGAEVLLFDGRGAEFLARVERVHRTAVELSIIERRAIDRELPLNVILGVALPKGDRQRWLIEKGVELGAARLVPLMTQRGVAQPVASAVERLRRSVIEASKQCGRNRLLEIGPAEALASFCAGQANARVRWIAHPGGEPLARAVAGLDTLTPGEQVALAVGPEGGFTAEEVALAQSHSWQPVDLGRRILRVETAAYLLVGAVAAAVEGRKH